MTNATEKINSAESAVSAYTRGKIGRRHIRTFSFLTCLPCSFLFAFAWSFTGRVASRLEVL